SSIQRLMKEERHCGCYHYFCSFFCAGKYKWQTYKEVCEMIQKVGSFIRSCGYGQGVKCGIYGANCPGWIISMEACNAQGFYCVPLYDTL
ncbi:hypothetical protein S83_023834, partial [Arachis hypogaea]